MLSLESTLMAEALSGRIFKLCLTNNQFDELIVFKLFTLINIIKAIWNGRCGTSLRGSRYTGKC